MINVTEMIRRLREESPLLGRNARRYIADVLETMFKAHTNHLGTSDALGDAGVKQVILSTPLFDAVGKGMRVMVHFTHGNTAENVSLLFTHIGTFPVRRRSNWPDDAIVEFLFDGTQFRMVGARKAPLTEPVVDTEGKAIIGTDDGAYATADHSHILYVDHHTDHITRGRLHLDRLPTSEEANRVLAVGEANTSPAFQQINHEMIGDDAVRTRHIKDRNVTTEKIAHRAVTGYELFTSDTANRVLAVGTEDTDPAFQQINHEMIGDDAVRTRHIKDRNVTTEKIAHRAVTGYELFTSNTANRILAVGTEDTDPAFQQANHEMIADDAVRTQHILNQNVTAEKIADDAVRTHHILDQNVTAEKIADDAVRTRHILDQNVTTAKIADLNVTREKIADRAVNGAKLFSAPEGEGYQLLRVNAPGTDPYWGKIQLPSDMEGILPIENGGTNADNAFDARANLFAAPESIVFGPVNVHQNSPWIVTFDGDKRLELRTNGNYFAHDNGGGFITGWYTASFATAGREMRNVNGSGSVMIDDDTGYLGALQRAARNECTLFFHRDNSVWRIHTITRANNSAAGAPTATRLQQAMFIIRQITPPTRPIS